MKIRQDIRLLIALTDFVAVLKGSDECRATRSVLVLYLFVADAEVPTYVLLRAVTHSRGCISRF